MQKLWKLVSSPRHLLVFEAAARTGSFTKAAQELNVQQPAVSASIKQLEHSLGVRLFDRAHRLVTLTHAGERLFNEVSSAFDQIYRTAEILSNRNQQAHVTLSASTAFAHYWMVPRLAQFHEAHPNIDLRLQTSEREPAIGSDGVSLAIRRGTGAWPGCDTHLIAPEIIMPIAAPRVNAAAINLKTVANLLNETLIHLEEPIRERPSWVDFFAHWNVPYAEPKVGLRLNDYALVLQATIAGEGFAFGWQHVTQQLISQRLLVSRPEWAWETGAGFYLVWSNSVPLNPQEQAVRDWLIDL
ncbi:LysR substrate-binding domain-containing protein [Roseovarius phycicola]|uniref:LysR substrate-binding domain-containing protein n=1 Tax=Roseovarius phycicola TaxID=3080976 RepID=UPI0030D14432